MSNLNLAAFRFGCFRIDLGNPPGQEWCGNRQQVGLRRVYSWRRRGAFENHHCSPRRWLLHGRLRLMKLYRHSEEVEDASIMGGASVRSVCTAIGRSQTVPARPWGQHGSMEQIACTNGVCGGDDTCCIFMASIKPLRCREKTRTCRATGVH